MARIAPFSYTKARNLNKPLKGGVGSEAIPTIVPELFTPQAKEIAGSAGDRAEVRDDAVPVNGGAGVELARESHGAHGYAAFVDVVQRSVQGHDRPVPLFQTAGRWLVSPTIDAVVADAEALGCIFAGRNAKVLQLAVRPDERDMARNRVGTVHPSGHLATVVDAFGLSRPRGKNVGDGPARGWRRLHEARGGAKGCGDEFPDHGEGLRDSSARSLLYRRCKLRES
jgi:hypothetical protein